jgi:3-deoxy-D-manno-octulosonic-acid transferase
MSFARFIYSMLMLALMPVLLLRLLWRARREHLYGQAIAERFGVYRHPAQSGSIWIHAVSLGETRAVQELVQALRQTYPEMRFVFTHGTATGRQQGESLLREGDVQVWQPWDVPFAVERFLRHFQPRIGLLVDTEVWPNTVARSKAHGLPLVLLNGRLSARSLRKALRWPSLSRPAFQGLHAIWAQTADDAKRFEQLGAKVQAVMGNLKFDAVPDQGLLQRGLAWRAKSAQPVVLLAISREGEEAQWLKVLFDHPSYLHGVQWWVVPRHPQRFDEVADLVQAGGHALIRRSQWGAELQAAASDHPQDAVVLGDSMGEMPFYYGAASVCLLGGSFEPLGGQNLIEACACGCPVVMGPHTFNFTEAARLSLESGSAVRVKDMREAVSTAHALATDAQALHRMRQSTQSFATQHQGAVARCLTLLTSLL